MLGEVINDNQPLVSIVIPTYNYGRFISDAIESALGQSHENIEVLVVDDGSTDDTATIVQQYGARLSYFPLTHQGVSSVRNYGILKANGKYIVCLDSDDKLDENYVEKALALLEVQSSSCGYVFTQAQCFGASDYTTQFPGFNLDFLKITNCITASCLVKSDVAKNHPYDDRLNVMEDWDFYLTLAEHGIGGILLNEPLYQYRKHLDGGSTLDNVTEREKLRQGHIIFRKHRKIYGVLRTMYGEAWYLIQGAKERYCNTGSKRV